MRNWVEKAERLRSVRRAAEMFLGKFAADCLLSRERPLDRIARDLRCVSFPAGERRQSSNK